MQSHYRLAREEDVLVLELLVPAAALASDFDDLNAAVLRELSADRGKIGDVVIDLSRCTYVGSAALGFLINVRQHANERRGVTVLCGVMPAVLSVLRTSSIGRLFNIVDSRESAIAFVKRKRTK
jgi:anti-anti-sigma factor